LCTSEQQQKQLFLLGAFSKRVNANKNTKTIVTLEDEKKSKKNLKTRPLDLQAFVIMECNIIEQKI